MCTTDIIFILHTVLSYAIFRYFKIVDLINDTVFVHYCVFIFFKNIFWAVKELTSLEEHKQFIHDRDLSWYGSIIYNQKRVKV